MTQEQFPFMQWATSVLMVAFLLGTTSFGQAAPTDAATRNNDFDMRGRIVLYRWVDHELTESDQFVVKTADKTLPLVRVIYRPFWGFDAPIATQRDRLDRSAFVAHGSMWTFKLHPPTSGQEKIECARVEATEKYRDETGEGEIPLFVPTPGADLSEVPALASLPCYILRYGGLSRVGEKN